uniref:Uncharacterized protein n=1 Tax=Cacopsylla melanoneura TaxID=428564 RepID=A0A8D8R3B2_9HEMI
MNSVAHFSASSAPRANATYAARKIFSPDFVPDSIKPRECLAEFLSIVSTLCLCLPGQSDAHFHSGACCFHPHPPATRQPPFCFPPSQILWSDSDPALLSPTHVPRRKQTPECAQSENQIPSQTKPEHA